MLYLDKPLYHGKEEVARIVNIDGFVVQSLENDSLKSIFIFISRILFIHHEGAKEFFCVKIRKIFEWLVQYLIR